MKAPQLIFHFSVYILHFVFPSAKAQNCFEKHFGDTLIPETGIAAIQTQRGFIYYAGTVTDTAVNRADIAFLKMDSKGNVIWKKTFGTANGDYCNDMALSPDSAFILTGYSYNYSNSTADWLMLKADTAGNLIWMKVQGKATIGETFNDVEITKDKGFIACGSISDTTGGTGNNLFVVKFDSLCNKQWEKQYGSNLNDYAMSAKEETNGDFVISADRILGSGIYNAALLRISSSGGLVWDKDIVSPYNSGCKRFIITSSGDYLIAGESATASSSKFDAFFVKATAAGNILWQRYIGNVPEAEAAFQLYEYAPSRFAVCGYGQKNSEGKTKIIFLAIDSAANELYRKYYGNYLVNMGYNISPSVYGGFLIAGFSTGVEDHYVLIADSIPQNVGMPEQGSQNKFVVYPNPGSLSVSVSVGDGMTFFDLAGQEVLRSEGREANVSVLPAGLYLLRINYEDRFYYSKFVKN